MLAQLGRRPRRGRLGGLHGGAEVAVTAVPFELDILQPALVRDERVLRALLADRRFRAVARVDDGLRIEGKKLLPDRRLLLGGASGELLLHRVVSFAVLFASDFH